MTRFAVNGPDVFKWASGIDAALTVTKSTAGMDHGSACDLEIKLDAADGDVATFSGYGSKFGNIDNGRDMVMPGAFKDSLGMKKPGAVKMLWQHDPSQPIGMWTSLEEDKNGLKVAGSLLLGLQKAREVYEMMKAGIVDGLSIGYRVTKESYDTEKSGRAYRKIEKADLVEVSLVTFPMNPKATVTAVKTMPTDRELEAMLRDEAGLSNRDAKAAVSVFKKTLRDGGETAQGPRDADLSAISSELARLLATIQS